MVLVADPFSCACCPCQLKHPLTIRAEQSLVEVKYDPGLLVFKGVLDQRLQAAPVDHVQCRFSQRRK
jgi:hypothetical protein